MGMERDRESVTEAPQLGCVQKVHPLGGVALLQPAAPGPGRRLPRRFRRRTVFALLATKSNGTFKVEPVAAHAFGGELVVTHGRVSLTLGDRNIITDVIAVWRIRERRVAEVWDIPAVFTAQV
jgi:hypothetical protein